MTPSQDLVVEESVPVLLSWTAGVRIEDPRIDRFETAEESVGFRLRCAAGKFDKRLEEQQLRAAESVFFRNGPSLVLTNSRCPPDKSHELPHPILDCRIAYQAPVTDLGRSNLLTRRLEVNRTNPRRWLSTFADYERWKKVLANCRQGHYLRLSDERELLILCNAVHLSYSTKWWDAEQTRFLTSKAKSPPGPIRVAYFTFGVPKGSTTGKAEVIPLPELPEYHEIDPRFAPPKKIDYAAASALRTGHTLAGKRPLFRAYDPLFGELAVTIAGKNCLTDGWEISLPLYWTEHWHSPVFDRCRGFAQIGRQLYEQRVRHLEGKPLVGIEEILDDPAHPSLLLKRKTPRREPAELRTGQCFDGRALRIEAFGPNEVYTVKLGEKIVYYVDSECYGTALKAYLRYEDAVSWARGGLSRAALRRRGDNYLWWLAHDPGQCWRTFLAENEAAYIAGQAIPNRFRLIGAPPAAPLTAVPLFSMGAAVA